MSFTTFLIPSYSQMLTALSAWLAKAQEVAFRLSGQDLPESVGILQAEGQNAGEHPGSIAEAQARIGESLALLEQLDDDALDKTIETHITLDLPNGMSFDLTKDQYVRDWSLPQFYFHVMTAYSLLRANGVELGKADYVQHMFAYLEPQT